MNDEERAPLLLRVVSPVLKTNQKKLATENTRNIFVLSTGRTGTTYLAEYFDGDDVYALHEPKPSRILRMWSMAFFEKKASKAYMRTVLYNKRKRIYTQNSHPIYLESNPYLVGFADVLKEVFNDPIIIHVVRDPREYVKSSMNHGNASGIKLFFNNYVPFWHPNIEKLLGLNQKLDMRYRAAAYWRLVNEHLQNFGANNPNYHLTKYEELFDDKKSGLEKVAKIIGTRSGQFDDKSVSSKGVNKSKHKAVPSWHQWTNEECKTINDLCQPLMGKLGYGLEKEWKDKIK